MTLASGTTGWLVASAAAAAVAIGAGAAVAASGVLAPEPAPVSLVFAQTVDGLDCPGGGAVMSFPQNSRVLAIARSADGAYLGVRNPLDVGTTVWVPAAAVDADAGRPALERLELGGCDVPVVTATTEAAQPPVIEPPAPAPGQPAPPAPPPAAPANAAPVLGQASASSSQLGCVPGFLGKPETATISVQATDDGGVVGVTATLSGAETGTRALSPGSGNSWSFVYNPADTIPNGSTVTVTLRATDGALPSNSSALTINVQCLG